MSAQLADSLQGDLTFQELVEVVTDYLEGALAPHDLALFERHLDACPPCVAYIDQIRQTIRLVGRLQTEQIAPTDRERLVALFRSWRDG